MIPFFPLLEQSYAFRDWHLTRQINTNTPSTQKNVQDNQQSLITFVFPTGWLKMQQDPLYEKNQ